jgi:hypothetical protein
MKRQYKRVNNYISTRHYVGSETRFDGVCVAHRARHLVFNKSVENFVDNLPQGYGNVKPLNDF